MALRRVLRGKEQVKTIYCKNNIICKTDNFCPFLEFLWYSEPSFECSYFNKVGPAELAKHCRTGQHFKCNH